MSTQSIKARFDTLRELAYTGISSSYAAVGSALAYPPVHIVIENLTDAAMYFSLDGVNAFFKMPANSFYVCDISSNQTNPKGLRLQAGDILYVLQASAPSLGSVCFTVLYGSDN